MGIISNGNTIIDNGAIEANEVDTTQLATDAVETAKIADANVTSAKISYPLTTFSSTGIDDNATSTAITIDSSENVGIGTTSPGSKLQVESSGTTVIRITGGTTSDSQINFGDPDDGNVGMLNYDHSQNSMKFVVNNSERMRINDEGDVLIGADTFSSGSRVKQFEINAFTIALRSGSTTTAFQFHQEFHNPNGSVGTISTSGSATAYNTSSDYRLKENVNYDFDATTRLKQLKPARFNFIADANTTVDGFLAHEVQDIVPEAITGIKDETKTKEKVVVNVNGQVIAQNIEQADWEAGKIADEEGNTKYPTDSTWEATKVVPVYQGIDQAKLVPLLVKTIQELEARITALENA